MVEHQNTARQEVFEDTKSFLEIISTLNVKDRVQKLEVRGNIIQSMFISVVRIALSFLNCSFYLSGKNHFLLIQCYY